MNELYHHGILGQKWGERNGPPYPLDREDHSAEEKRKNHFSKDSSKDSSSNKSSKPKKGLTKGQKTAIKVGVGVVGTAIAAYGAYRLVKSGKIGKLIKKGKELINGKDLEDLKDTTKEYIHRTPFEEASLTNPKYFEGPEYQSNCVLSSLAYAYRREGYKIQPGKSLFGYTAEETRRMFEKVPMSEYSIVKDLEVPIEKLKFSPLDLKLRRGRGKIVKEAMTKRGEKVINELERQISAKFNKPGERGIFNLYTAFGGHEMAWEVKGDGKVVILNPQFQRLFTDYRYKDTKNLWFGAQKNFYYGSGKTKINNPIEIYKTNNLKLSDFGKAHLTTEDGKALGSGLMNTISNFTSTVMSENELATVAGTTALTGIYEARKAKKKAKKKAEEEKKKEDKK